MERKIRAVQYGCGRMSSYIIKHAIEKGVEFVGAFDRNPAILGKDLSEVNRFDIPYQNVEIKSTDDADKALAELKPDICIITTRSLMKDLKEAMLVCAKNGVNAITTCEEALYPWNSSFKTTSEIDKLAKETGCTITGSGYQDLCYGNLVTALSGASQTITKIVGSSSYNVEDYGIALAEVHGAGLDVETFNEKIAAADNISEEERDALIEKEEFLPAYMWNANGWICSQLGLTVTKRTQKCVPTFYDGDLESKTLGMTVKKGLCTGMSAVVTFETAEGITIESECIGKIYGPEDEDTNIWSIYGTPDNFVVNRKPKNAEMTCALIVNRIPDIINAQPGFVTSEKMPVVKYRVKPLNEYVVK